MRVDEIRERVMASELLVIAIDPPDGALADAIALLRRLERTWSRFVPDSDISRLNDAGGAPVVVDDTTIELVTVMLAAWRATSGAFDATVLPLVVEAGYDASIDDPTLRTRLPRARRPGQLGSVAVDHAARTVTLPHDVALDPGGIGKGFAADLAVERILTRGASGALVSIGGDMAMGGTPPTPAGWLVAIDEPDRPDAIRATIGVAGGGVATSSPTSRRRQHAHRSIAHVIDVRARRPVETDLASVTVIAPTGWQAEAHATAALHARSDDVVARLERHQLSGIAFDQGGRALATTDLAGVR